MLWQLHMKNPLDHAAALNACEAFMKADPSDPFAAVAQTIAAWHFLKSGRTDEARAALTPCLKASSDPVHMGARELARAWLTRLDIEAVKSSLQAYYRNEVRYPESISALAVHPRIPDSMRPPLTDRWGNAWSYKLEDFRAITLPRGQRYRLESPKLKGTSGIEAALEVPYADLIRVQPVKALRSADGRPMVQFSGMKVGADSNTVSIIQEGSSAEGIFLAHVGPKLILVCDDLHWRVLPIPQR